MIPHTIKTNGHLKDPQTETSKITIWIIKDEVSTNPNWILKTTEVEVSQLMSHQKTPNWNLKEPRVEVQKSSNLKFNQKIKLNPESLK